MTKATGPLVGIRVVEFAGIGPGPLAGTLLSDLGADVLRIERPGVANPDRFAIDARGRRTITLDLKSESDLRICKQFCAKAELLFEGNRPGVMERLGLGPDELLSHNPALVYARITGWGQYGPYSASAGHDINYLAVTGALHAIGPADAPVPPLNLVGDYGGGAMFLVVGLLSALLHARATGEGQVVDVAMTDGASYLMTPIFAAFASGLWQDKRMANLLDGGAPFYGTYRCADDGWISIGAIEPQFFALLVEKLDAKDALSGDRWNRDDWPQMHKVLTEIFARRTRDEWTRMLENTDVCFAPVLSLEEAPKHQHNLARETFVKVDGVIQPAPAPRFSATPGGIRWSPAPIETDVQQILSEWGAT